MQTITLDLETFSSVDLGECGLYKYTSSPDFEILLFGYSIDGEAVKTVDLASGEKIPEKILAALSDKGITKCAFNAAFERVCLSRWLHKRYPEHITDEFLSPEGWHCDQALAAYSGLPQSLGDCGEALGIEKQKLTEGKELINYFCKPCLPTKANGGRTRNMPSDAPEKWELFKRYNVRDVEAETEIASRLERPYASFWDEYNLDQRINDRGVLLDMPFVKAAITLSEMETDRLKKRAVQLTGLENPNSVKQLTEWLASNGVVTDSLDKASVEALLAQKDLSSDVRETLEIRQQISKTSVKKYLTMLNCVEEDGRVRGLFQFYGANRTGRFSGRLLQLQNLKRNGLKDIKGCRAAVRDLNMSEIERHVKEEGKPVQSVLSELVRTALIPETGKKFIVCDFSSIEARVLAWLAEERWVLNAFANGEDLYCETASRMFKKPVVKHGENGELRAKGKIAVLACGYGGSVQAMKAMGGDALGMSEDDMQETVDMWRKANPKAVKLWREFNDKIVSAAKTYLSKKADGRRCVAERRTINTADNTPSGCHVLVENDNLYLALPSGRSLTYRDVRPVVNRFGGDSFAYMNLGKNRKWVLTESYGAKAVENCVQAIARDLLVNGMQKVTGALPDNPIVAHVHDEIIVETSPETKIETVAKLMSDTPDWAKGLPLSAAGYECLFYQKDDDDMPLLTAKDYENAAKERGINAETRVAKSKTKPAIR